jgi:poly(A) polymerase
MALDIETGQLVDPFSGAKDLENKLIRAAGKPEERFQEDYSRMLRAIRFSAQFGFEIEKETWRAIKKLMPKINSEKKVDGKKERIIPHESIAKELAKSLAANPVKTLELYDESGAIEELIPELLEMKDCPQPKEFHTEGDVWKHTKLALKNLKSKKFKKQFPDGKITPELAFTVLIHDIGKPPTIKTPEKDGTDRIRFDEHTEVGAKMAAKITERLALANFNIKPERVNWLVQNHLLGLHGTYKEMKNSTIEKYFFDKETGEPSERGKNLLMLIFVDSLATIPPSGEPALDSFYGLQKRIEDLKSLTKEKVRLPKSLIDGNDIMKAFNLKPGPKIGELLKDVREKQLAGKIKSKKEGIKFLKNKIKKTA